MLIAAMPERLIGRKAKNIALIGMPAVGKSKIGRQLAAACGREFVDTDTAMEKIVGMPLQEFLNTRGPEALLDLERKTVLRQLRRGKDMVLAPGGSVVHSEEAMEAMRDKSMIVYLYASFEAVAGRVLKKPERGIIGIGPDVIKNMDTHSGKKEFLGLLKDIYDQRARIFHRWADLILDASVRNEDTMRDMVHEMMAFHAKARQGTGTRPCKTASQIQI